MQNIKNEQSERLLIAISGGIGAGKSIISKHIHKYFNIPKLDFDQLGHQVLTDDIFFKRQLIHEFGSTITSETVQGSKPIIDRKALGSIVFNDSSKLLWLEQQMHPRIQALFSEKLALLPPSPYTLVEVSLFFDKYQTLHSLFDA